MDYFQVRTKFTGKAIENLYERWRAFKRMRTEIGDVYGPKHKTWISMLDREQLIEELFNRIKLMLRDF